MSDKKNSNKNTGKNQEQMYQQCLLRKRSGNVSILDVSWIPVEYSIIGKSLKLWTDDIENEWGIKGNWDDNWIVIKVYGVKSESDIIKMTWDYRKWDWIRE